VSEELQAKDILLYQQYIGVLRLACGLGQADILTKVSMMSSHIAMPRKGHMEALYFILHTLENMKTQPSYLMMQGQM
jgi:hypothetical protein